MVSPEFKERMAKAAKTTRGLTSISLKDMHTLLIVALTASEVLADIEAAATKAKEQNVAINPEGLIAFIQDNKPQRT